LKWRVADLLAGFPDIQIWFRNVRQIPPRRATATACNIQEKTAGGRWGILNKPPGINLTSSNTRPIKATRTPFEIIKANKKSIENSKTGKVTAVVAIMKIFGKNLGNSRNPNYEKNVN
jgi:hypothetical protein